jgi:hypothetical protein
VSNGVSFLDGAVAKQYLKNPRKLTELIRQFRQLGSDHKPCPEVKKEVIARYAMMTNRLISESEMKTSK